MGPGFAAELRGVTLSDVAADDAAYAAVRAAFEEHSVLVFRDQQVTDDIQLAFSRRFGQPEVTKVGSMGTGSHFVILSTIGPDGKVVPADHRQALRSKANQLWHTDSSFKRVPALTSILSARTIPQHGGETEFVSMRLAFERLDAGLQKKLENSFAWHSYAHSRGQIAPGLATPEEQAALPPVCWRMVWKNPVNGRGAIYLASHAYAVEGMDAAVGKKLIDELTGSRDRAWNQLSAPMAAGRRRDVGQPRHHASRAAMAGTRGAADDPHHDLGHRRRRCRGHGPVLGAGGGVNAQRKRAGSGRTPPQLPVCGMLQPRS